MGGSYLKQIYVSNDGRYKITATMAYIYKKKRLELDVEWNKVVI